MADQSTKLSIEGQVKVSVDQQSLEASRKKIQDGMSMPIGAAATGAKNAPNTGGIFGTSDADLKRNATLLSQTKEYLGVLEKINREKERQYQQESRSYQQRRMQGQNTFAGGMGFPGGPIIGKDGVPRGTPGGGGGGGGGAGESLDVGGFLKKILGAAGLGISVAAGTRAAMQAYQFYNSEKMRTISEGGSAVSNTVGYLNNQMLSGDVVGQTLTQSKMRQSAINATAEYDDRLSTQAKKAWAYLGDEKDMEYFQNQRQNEISKNTLEQAQSSLEKDNNLMLAKGFFQQNFTRNLNAERSLGLGSDQFKRFQIGLNDKGFLTDQGTNLLSQVQSAGGMASGAQSSNIANLGLQMQRGFNITNAGNVLGKLTGMYGNSAAGMGRIDDASKRILEESITKGFNKSENTEILRRFTEQSAALVYQSEAKTPEDIGRIVDSFAKLLSGNPTTKQFEAAQSAYQRYQGLTSETSGRGGTLGFASFLRGGNFSQLGALQIGNLMELQDNQITSTNSDVIAAATQQGISPETMAKNIRQAKRTQALSTVGLSEKMLDPLRKYLGKSNIDTLIGNTEEQNMLKELSPEGYKAFQAITQRSHIAGKSDSDEEVRANIREFYNQEGAGPTTTDQAAQQLRSGTAGKKEEEVIAAQAAQEKRMVLNLKELEDQLIPTAQGIDNLTKIIIALGTAAKLASDSGLGDILSRSDPRQVQTRSSPASKPSNGSKPSGQ